MGYTSKYAQDAMNKVVNGGDTNTRSDADSRKKKSRTKASSGAKGRPAGSDRNSPKKKKSYNKKTSSTMKSSQPQQQLMMKKSSRPMPKNIKGATYESETNYK